MGSRDLKRDQLCHARRYSGELGDAACPAVSGGIAVLHHALKGGATLIVRAIEAASKRASRGTPQKVRGM